MPARCPCSDTRSRGIATRRSLVSAPSSTNPGSTAISRAGRTCGFWLRHANRPRGTASGQRWSAGLAQRAGDRAAEYSLGMRRRLGVAACLLADPELLLLDEPVSGLDPAGMAEMRDMILSIVAEGRTAVSSSRLLDEVERTCDAVAIVDRGSIIQQGTIAELLAGARLTLQVGCSEPGRARALLAGTTLGARVAAVPSALGPGITLPAGTGRDAIAEGGIPVCRL